MRHLRATSAIFLIIVGMAIMTIEVVRVVLALVNKAPDHQFHYSVFGWTFAFIFGGRLLWEHDKVKEAIAVISSNAPGIGSWLTSLKFGGRRATDPQPLPPKDDPQGDGP